MSSIPINLDPNIPYPARYWWTKRIAAGCLGVLLALFGAWAIWWNIAKTRLAAEIASIRARGELIYPEEFNSTPVPNDQNAAIYLDAATAALSTTAYSPRSTDMEYPNYLPMSAEWLSVAKSARAGNAKTLALARKTRQYSRVDPKLAIQSPAYGILLPGLNSQRELANLLGDIATLDHLEGNDAEAIERLRDLFHIADIVDEQPFLVSHLVATGIRAVGMSSLNVLTPGMNIADDPSTAPATQPTGPARREQVHALIKIMLDLSTRDRMHRVFQAERMGQLDMVEWFSGKSVLLKPMYRLDGLNMMRAMRPIVAAASQPTLPAASVPKMWAASSAAPQWTTMMTSAFTPSLNRAMETDFRVRAEAAMSAVLLAGRLYQMDHQGSWSPNLEALVPQYLPAVPIDPMSSTPKSLGYIILSNGRRPLVYSVGPDDYDDTEKGSTPPATPQTEYLNSTADQWRDLSRFDPPPKPATSPTAQ